MSCQVTTTTKATASSGQTTYYCPSGYTRSGSGSSMSCYDVQYTNVIVKPGRIDYSCPKDYDKSGSGVNTKCSKSIKSDDKYYCEDINATLKDNKCYKTTNSEFLGYECPEGYNLDNSYCYKPTTQKVKAQEVCNTDIPIEKDGVDVSKTSIGNLSTFDMIMYFFIVLGTIIVSIEITLYNKQRKDRINYY